MSFSVIVVLIWMVVVNMCVMFFSCDKYWCFVYVMIVIVVLILIGIFL